MLSAPSLAFAFVLLASAYHGPATATPTEPSSMSTTSSSYFPIPPCGDCMECQDECQYNCTAKNETLIAFFCRDYLGDLSFNCSCQYPDYINEVTDIWAIQHDTTEPGLSKTAYALIGLGGVALMGCCAVAAVYFLGIWSVLRKRSLHSRNGEKRQLVRK